MNNNYNTNIENTRISTNMNPNKNPYINQNIHNIQENQMNPQAKSTFNNGDFVKGALIGAAVTFLLTNKNAQETIFKAFGKGNELFQAAMEEAKERYEDAQAQREATQEF